jgi:hypothetical protein
MKACMKREYYLKIVYDTEAEEIESVTEDVDDMEDTVYLDVDDHMVKVPKELVKYLDEGVLGLS